MTSPRDTGPVLLLLALLTGCSGSSGRPAAVPTTATPSALPTVTATTPPPTETPEDPLSPRPAVESPAPIGQPTCHAADLTVTDADSVVGDTTVQEVFVVRTSGAPCQLDGWPAVRLLDASGAAVAGSVRHGGFGLPPTQPAPVTLNRETSVSFSVATHRTGSCRQAARLEVTLPGTSTPLRATTGLRVCDGAGTTPVQRLADVEGGGQTPTD